MGKQKTPKKGVPYHGQQPHCQGRRPPGPLVCFSLNFRNALRRTFFPSLKDNGNEDGCHRKANTRIDCLLDLLSFDVNQLFIYENRKMKSKNCDVIKELSSMKLKIKEVKRMASSSNCLVLAEAILRTRVQLKCSSRGFRRKLVELMGGCPNSERSLRIACSIMQQLDAMDLEISCMCKSERDACCRAQLSGSRSVKFADRKDSVGSCVGQKNCSKVKLEQGTPTLPGVGSNDSIHLRYIPQLDSFKANMAKNPCAMRLPLMSPPMKRIMNKMRTSYLMDDIPFQGPIREKKSKSKQSNKSNSLLQVMYSTLWQNCLYHCGEIDEPELLEGPLSQKLVVSSQRPADADTDISLNDIKTTSKEMFSAMMKQLKEKYTHNH